LFSARRASWSQAKDLGAAARADYRQLIRRTAWARTTVSRSFAHPHLAYARFGLCSGWHEL